MTGVAETHPGAAQDAGSGQAPTQDPAAGSDARSSAVDHSAPGPVTRILSAPFVWLIRLYQLLISPMLTQTCRFYPSCSAYAVTALQRYGPLRGGWMALRRLGRCHPWNPGGVDHVPERRDGSNSGSQARTKRSAA